MAKQANIGQVNRLKVVKEVEFGLYLDAGQLGEVLLPNRYVPNGAKVGDELEVFIYQDSQDRLVATTDKPMASVGEVAFLRVKQVNRTGAFLNWGMPKDLMVPYAEQRVPMEEGRSYCVYLYVDQSGRIAASSKLSLFLKETNTDFKSGQEVSLLVASRSNMGYTAVIDGTHLGLIHNSDILQPLRMGQKLKGYIKGIRPDLKINLTLQKQGREGREELADQILAHLEENGGRSDLVDKSSPEAIFKQYRVSKAKYKKALGQLYKVRKIAIEEDHIELL
ncbi:S1-like domain-containing RNA-binding protein [Thiomicrorhabdus sp. ZW0627]|uniref:CvfB family protein n=1 Tax=Thiomicrorhabdus sp. ZW0627 TaxID=3039774 RepID=UPI0024372079|nr:S1-like domain-containing RNA-binding protein [Thiomicrorhabdus sp. ZW0627]MDG6773912.1 S1-like domain-containing RNA-binding protein [Thiomicrorhabdus sp. ZW0627]